MSDPAPRAERMRRALSRLAPSLQVIAEHFLGLGSRIDALALDDRGQLVLVFETSHDEDLARLGDALAQRAWAEPRVADWLQLAPGLGLRPELGVRVLLLGPDFDPRTRLAAESIGEDRIRLLESRAEARPHRAEFAGEHATPRTEFAGEPQSGAAEPVRREARAALPAAGVRSAAAPSLASVFRTGLEPGDL